MGEGKTLQRLLDLCMKSLNLDIDSIGIFRLYFDGGYLYMTTRRFLNFIHSTYI